MGRPQKKTAEWFPHYVGDSRTLFILESKWGNDGYSFWFKLLELLCRNEGHYYDCSKRSNMEYLAAVARLPEEQVTEMIGMLVDLERIDRELWENRKIIWCQNLVDNLKKAYSKRTVSVPDKPVFDEFSPRKDDSDTITGEKTPEKEKQTEDRGQEEKPAEKARRKRKSDLTVKQQELFEQFYSVYPKKVDRATAEKAWAKIEPEPDGEMTDRIVKAVEDAKKYDSRFREKRFTPNPASWLNAKGYLNEYQEGTGDGGNTESQGETAGFRPSGGFKSG